MRVIDAFSGHDVKVGDTLVHPDKFQYSVLKINAGLFAASIVVATPRGVQEWPLQVRWTHPHYFLQHIGFIPT